MLEHILSVATRVSVFLQTNLWNWVMEGHFQPPLWATRHLPGSVHKPDNIDLFEGRDPLSQATLLQHILEWGVWVVADLAYWGMELWWRLIKRMVHVALGKGKT